MNKDNFKKDIADALFLATKSEELSVERLQDVADKIAEKVYESASKLVLAKASKWLKRQARYSITNNILNEQENVEKFIFDLALEIRL